MSILPTADTVGSVGKTPLEGVLKTTILNKDSIHGLHTYLSLSICIKYLIPSTRYQVSDTKYWKLGFGIR